MRHGVSVFVVLAAAVVLAAPAPAKPKLVRVTVRVDSAAPGYEGHKAMDGNPRSMWHTRWQYDETPHPHELVVDLGASYTLSGLAYLPREGGGNGTIKAYECCVGDDPKSLGKPVVKGTFARRNGENVVTFPKPVRGRYLCLRALSEVAGRPWTSIAELRILADGATFRARGSKEAYALRPKKLRPRIAKTEAEHEFLVLQHNLRQRSRFERIAEQTFRREALILPADRDPVDIVLRRTAALLADLKTMRGAPDLSEAEQALSALRAEAADVDVADAEARFALFKKVRALRRRIAFANPLLSFDKLLFIKRHRATFNHMCDQYYGINALPGGGLYVLTDPFGGDPQVHDLLADAVVERGRLKGKKLEGGSFLSPGLSYDARTIAFAYVECEGSRSHDYHTDPSRGHWAVGRSYHILKVHVDPDALSAGGLEQLTDGTWNDFDPCWLPNDRMAFISERRGGYLRCGRVCPTYTLYDMQPDGSDIRCLSFHETNEWHPSVTHDGRILYTRWDYVDRHGCTAHLPWITTLDGRDSRAVHGNFAPRRSRPDMEVDCRAIPGSHKFVATAAPHHGQAFGSLVIIDPQVEDDDRMAPVRRITPEVDFPESQGGAQVYGTAWPLSETYYLCVYDASMKRGMGRQGRRGIRGNYGIYLVDAFGNRELIYRDPNIACQSPMPLRPQSRPPALPPASRKLEGEWAIGRPDPGNEAVPDATAAVLNVYDSIKPWPQGTRIAALRVLQLVPMSVPSGRPPHEVGLRLPSARDSVTPVRYVLGTVPVEADGSAHFVLPAHKEVFFQALDENGLAVQSMRSATYLQAGERLVCQGCHEPKYASPAQPPSLAKALRRPPSRLEADVDGSNPFSYPRLVQPVLDRHCVKCHTKNAPKAPDLSAKPTGRSRWYQSYVSLAPKYGFWNYHDGYRTTPGKFGARAAKLYQMLRKGHHDLKLPPEDLHRITLWLDCCSIFYGVYEKEGGLAQLRGEVVKPTLE